MTAIVKADDDLGDVADSTQSFTARSNVEKRVKRQVSAEHSETEAIGVHNINSDHVYSNWKDTDQRIELSKGKLIMYTVIDTVWKKDILIILVGLYNGV